VSALRTEYEFVLPRGYLDSEGNLHKRGTMRLATARDELEPLRDPTINSADDPRLTILVLARVVRTLGTLDLVTAHEIEGLFAADLAYLQDFYGVINFGTPADIEAMMQAQEEMERSARQGASRADDKAARSLTSSTVPGTSTAKGADAGTGNGQADEGADAPPAPTGRRAAIEEVPTSPR
jgi:hypothetical protein